MESKAEMLTVKQFSEKLNISRQGAYNLIHQGKIPVCRVGRKILISADRLKEWIEKGGTAYENS